MFYVSREQRTVVLDDEDIFWMLPLTEGRGLLIKRDDSPEGCCQNVLDGRVADAAVVSASVVWLCCVAAEVLFVGKGQLLV